MGCIVVRGLGESVVKQFAAQAKEHGRSMEAESRDRPGSYPRTRFPARSANSSRASMMAGAVHTLRPLM